ncbi:hypothetical protein HDV03_001611 [Kappamyces sp. JEL0829]|nr:hypothetical protein HDV03_001611 [Kappamyces sp. JEL0829]
MFQGGSLKLKGESGVKKKKKKSKKEPDTGEMAAARASARQAKTEAELQHEKIQQERLEKRIALLAEKSHKEKVNEFNKYLSKLSEHHDIPRVGPG